MQSWSNNTQEINYLVHRKLLALLKCSLDFRSNWLLTFEVNICPCDHQKNLLEILIYCCIKSFQFFNHILTAAAIYPAFGVLLMVGQTILEKEIILSIEAASINCCRRTKCSSFDLGNNWLLTFNVSILHVIIII